MIADQFPGWAGLRLKPVSSSGTDNVMLTLGDRLVVRLPRTAAAVPALSKEWNTRGFLVPASPPPDAPVR